MSFGKIWSQIEDQILGSHLPTVGKSSGLSELHFLRSVIQRQKRGAIIPPRSGLWLLWHPELLLYDFINVKMNNPVCIIFFLGPILKDINTFCGSLKLLWSLSTMNSEPNGQVSCGSSQTEEDRSNAPHVLVQHPLSTCACQHSAGHWGLTCCSAVQSLPLITVPQTQLVLV
jgi:hypothetical protein